MAPGPVRGFSCRLQVTSKALARAIVLAQFRVTCQELRAGARSAGRDEAGHRAFMAILNKPRESPRRATSPFIQERSP